MFCGLLLPHETLSFRLERTSTLPRQTVNAPVLPATLCVESDPRWRGCILPLCVGLLLLGVAFGQEVAAALHTWIASTAYNHCVLVIPIVGFLLWDRRADYAQVDARPTLMAAVLAAPLVLAWLVMERLGIMEGRQLAAIGFVELLFLALLGPRLWWTMSGPLLYLCFLVPFGEFLTPQLQDITTSFIRFGLGLLGVPAYIDGYVIEIPQGTFFIAEACAGLRFLIASVAFSCVYVMIMYRSPVRRGVFITVAIIVPIIANGFRGLGIVYLGYMMDSARAAAADHVIYGWMFFSIVILLLTLLGLPFRQDAVVPPPVRPYRALPPRHSVSVSVAAVIVVATVGPVLAAGLAIASVRPVAAPATVELGPGCSVVDRDAGASNPFWVETRRIICAGTTLDMTWEFFSPRVTAGRLMAERRRLIRPALTETYSQAWLSAVGDQPSAWSVMQSTEPTYLLAASIWIDGKPIRPGLAMRVKMAMDSLFGSDHAPLIMTIAPVLKRSGMTAADLGRAQASLTSFLLTHPDLNARIEATSALR